jgi:hypothetical protein
MEQSLQQASNISTKVLCHSMTHFRDEVKLESKKVDNLLANLRQYYADVKTH